MKRRRTAPARRVWLATGLLALLALSCGGGGGGGGNGGGTPGFAPTFTASNPNPAGTSITMAPGAQTGDTFEINIRVTGIQDFYGAAFVVTFDPASADFLNHSQTGSFIVPGAGTSIQFTTQPQAGGRVEVVASRRDESLGGVDAGATPQLLITLRFQATAETAGNGFAFGPAADREVQVCPTGGAQCSIVNDATITWSGGTLVVVGT